MRITIGSDERTHLTDAVIAELIRRGHQVTPIGPLAEPAEPLLWPAVARRVAEAVAAGAAASGADEGILFCWTGTGVSLAANKVPGIRAALCDDAETARGARLWNNANVLCLSLRRLSEVVAQEILDAWFATAYQPNPTDDEALAQVDAIEQSYVPR
ncbi:RpiB/LacA/LacB family sugar-phosphate isomerase [Promineifilum sp.]|uniref:RpiB/LacA/LacB family sugar-phosphate isomerase n=1 Tax=Promineifilum sp. TaxID=2664178 RepID=UPI0035AFF286